MRHSKGKRQPDKAVNTYSPNLTVMVHFYSCAEYLFRTVTMYPDIERERVFDGIVSAKSWYWGRYAREHRQSYLKTRLFVEARMREAFSRKYWPPKHPCPVYFYLYPKLSRPAIEERLRQREQLGEPRTKYFLVNLLELSDVTHVSFTLCDSHTSYRESLIEHGLSEKPYAAALSDHGTIFHIQEITDVYERHKGEDELYFEVQVWDPEILERWKGLHDIA